MKKIYCISGLGADERIYQNLHLSTPDLHFLQWITPLQNETISGYAKRMSEQVEGEEPLLMGVSFGGMMAIEIAKHISIGKIIVISSVKSSKELPSWLNISKRLKLNRLVPPRPWKWLSGIENYFLGANNPEEKKLANEFRQTVDPKYLHWAIDQVITWQNTWQPASLYHLHGSNDKIFPLKYVKPTHIIQGGGHFMIMNHPDEISAIIEDIMAIP